jgi:DNA polymerase-2
MRAFVLTPSYRVVDGVPQVHLYGVAEDGEPCLVIDDRVRPYFFVRASDEARLRQIAPRLRTTEGELRTFTGEPVLQVTVDLPGEVPPLRGRLAQAGVECLEADVRFAYRYLLDRGIRDWGASTAIPSCGRCTGTLGSKSCRSTSKRTRRASACSRSR